MSKTYVIQWKSKINGRAGRGTKHFPFEEAETLVHELNREYPNIHHELVDSESVSPVPSAEPTAEAQAGSQSTEPDKTSYETHAFSE